MKNNEVCRFFEKIIESDKVKDPCHLIGKQRGPARSNCNIFVKQSQNSFISVTFFTFSDYDCHLLFYKLFHKKNDKVKFKILPKTNEEFVSVKYGCIKFFHSYRFLSSSLEELVETLVDNSHKSIKSLKKEDVGDDILKNFVNEAEKLIGKVGYNKNIENLKKDCPAEIEKLEEFLFNHMRETDPKNLKTEFPDIWKKLTKNLAYPYEFFNCADGYQKLVDNLKNEFFFIKLKNECPDEKEKERTKELVEKVNIKTGEELTQLFLKSDVLIFACVFFRN